MSQISQELPALHTEIAPIYPCLLCATGNLLPQLQDPSRTSQIKESCALSKIMLFVK